MAGLRVELAIGSPDPCPVAETAACADAQASDVTWSECSCADTDDCTAGVTEQFRLDAADPDLPEDVESVFAYGSEGVYEVTRTIDDCVCERIEAAGYPVSDVRADADGLYVTLYLPGGGALSDVVKDLRASFGDVRIQTIARDDADPSGSTDIVPVDRGQLTDRQLEVLETAYAMGYFEYPREANASAVAEALDICPSTLAEHLAAAQSKVFGELLGTTRE